MKKTKTQIQTQTHKEKRKNNIGLGFKIKETNTNTNNNKNNNSNRVLALNDKNERMDQCLVDCCCLPHIDPIKSSSGYYDSRFKNRLNLRKGAFMTWTTKIPQQIFECNKDCFCNPDLCVNRVVQRHRIKAEDIGMVVKFCGKTKGWGVFATKEIQKGKLFIYYNIRVFSFFFVF